MTKDKKPAGENDSAAAEAEKGATDTAGAADNAESRTDAGSQVEEMTPEARIAELEAANANLKDQLLRALAEAENTRRRAERDRSDASKYGAVGFARDMLTIADNLRRALDAVPEGARDECDEWVRNFTEGVELIERELLNTFSKHAIRKLEPTGEPFDHAYHQAMFELEDKSAPAGTVVQLLQPGYTLHDRLLRPAMVGVAKGGPKPQKNGGNAENSSESSGGSDKT